MLVDLLRVGNPLQERRDHLTALNIRRVTRGRVLLLLLLLVAVVTGIWFYENGSITRLRAAYLPWMERLGRWRDACESTRRALRSRSATPADPEGIAALREWAWR